MSKVVPIKGEPTEGFRQPEPAVRVRVKETQDPRFVADGHGDQKLRLLAKPTMGYLDEEVIGVGELGASPSEATKEFAQYVKDRNWKGAMECLVKKRDEIDVNRMWKLSDSPLILDRTTFLVRVASGSAVDAFEAFNRVAAQRELNSMAGKGRKQLQKGPTDPSIDEVHRKARTRLSVLKKTLHEHFFQMNDVNELERMRKDDVIRGCLLQMLIMLGANVHARDELGFTALHYACLTASSYCVTSLIKNGARPIQLSDGYFVLHPTRRTVFPVLKAILDEYDSSFQTNEDNFKRKLLQLFVVKQSDQSKDVKNCKLAMFPGMFGKTIFQVNSLVLPFLHRFKNHDNTVPGAYELIENIQPIELDVALFKIRDMVWFHRDIVDGPLALEQNTIPPVEPVTNSASPEELELANNKHFSSLLKIMAWESALRFLCTAKNNINVNFIDEDGMTFVMHLAKGRVPLVFDATTEIQFDVIQGEYAPGHAEGCAFKYAKKCAKAVFSLGLVIFIGGEASSSDKLNEAVAPVIIFGAVAIVFLCCIQLYRGYRGDPHVVMQHRYLESDEELNLSRADDGIRCCLILILLKLGAEKTINAMDPEQGITALYLACCSVSAQCISVLMNHGADPRIAPKMLLPNQRIVTNSAKFGHSAIKITNSEPTFGQAIGLFREGEELLTPTPSREIISKIIHTFFEPNTSMETLTQYAQELAQIPPQPLNETAWATLSQWLRKKSTPPTLVTSQTDEKQA